MNQSRIDAVGAGSHTLLDMGFEVEQGATFFVEPDGCTNLLKAVVSPTTPISLCGNPDSPGNENFEKISDGDINTKFLSRGEILSEDNDSLGMVVDAGSAVIAESMDFTTADDVPDRDPTSFKIFGSNDSLTFTLIANGNIPCIPDRLNTRNFAFSNSTAYRYYRIQFIQVCNFASVNSIQIAEVQLKDGLATGLFSPASPIQEYGRVTSPPNQNVEKATDGDINSKFFSFFVEKDDAQLSFTLDLLENEIVTTMEITTANDVPDRDPTVYKIEGSLDNIFFSEISVGNIACLSDRFATRSFPFANNTPYRYYKITFLDACGGSFLQWMQLAEVQLYAKDFDP